MSNVSENLNIYNNTEKLTSPTYCAALHIMIYLQYVYYQFHLFVFSFRQRLRNLRVFSWSFPLSSKGKLHTIIDRFGKVSLHGIFSLFLVRRWGCHDFVYDPCQYSSSISSSLTSETLPITGNFL